MKKRFIVSLNGATTTTQQTAFMKYLDANGLNWWHWLDGTWLIIDITGSKTPQAISDVLLSFFPNIYHLIHEVPDAAYWFGFGPTNEADPKNNMFKWIRENWDT